MALPLPATPAGNRWTVAGLWLLLYGSFTLLSPPLLDGADAFHAEAARELLLGGGPMALLANGLGDAPHASLLIGCIAGSMDVFGVGAAQARLPLAACVLLLALLVEAFARKAFRSSRAGLYAAAILLLSPAMFVATRVLTPAAMVSLWHAAAIFCFSYTEDGQASRSGRAARPLSCLLFASACALNLLTAGVAGAALSCGAAVLYLLLTRGVRGALRRAGQLHPVPSLVAFLLVAASGYALLPQTGPQALLHGSAQFSWWLWHAAFSPGLPPGAGVPVGPSSGPSLGPWLLLLAGLLPWSGFLFKALGAVRWRIPASGSSLRQEEKAHLLLLIAGAVPLLLASVSVRRTPGILPALPFAAMLIARWLDREAAEADAMAVPPKLERAGMRVASVLVLAGAAAAFVSSALLLHLGGSALNRCLPALFPGISPSQLFALSRLLRADNAAESLQGPLLLCSLAPLCAALLNWRLRRSFQPQAGNLALAAGVLVSLTASHVAFNALSPVLTSEGLAAAVLPVLRPKEVLVVNGELEGASSLVFYLGRSDLHVLRSKQALSANKPGPDGEAPIVETAETLRQRWAGLDRVFLWTDSAAAPTLPSRAYVIAEGGGRQILSNKAGPY